MRSNTLNQSNTLNDIQINKAILKDYKKIKQLLGLNELII